MLLTHTAGTFPGMMPPGIMPNELGDLAKFVQAVSLIPAANIPGERVVYNTAASYAVLGGVLVATDPGGRSFRTIATEELFVPLGMTNTVNGLGQDDPRRVPISFTPANSTPATDATTAAMNAGFVEGAEVPAGSAFATIDDVYRFTQVYRGRGTFNNYRLISPALFEYARQNLPQI